ncbi:MAG TPA: YgjP-like metallopeptidase domain-containing protein [Pseudonocardiaceae bacterium]|nr:YgjP-like metallopeptidase domain-containing protein [Pseudonocardiaceae bacterium]
MSRDRIVGDRGYGDFVDAPAYTRALVDAGILGHLRWRVTVSVRRRTIGFTAEPGGALAIAVPRDADVAEVVAAVKARLPWMVRTANRQAEIAANYPAKEIVDGENFPYLGRPRRLVLVDDADDDVQLTGDRLLAVGGEPGRVAASIVTWYHRTGATWLHDRAPHWARRLGVWPTGVRVDGLGQRWGQRTKNGGIVLHWAVFQLPAHLVDLVVVHELAHLVEPQHRHAFHRLVGRVLPDHAERSEELAVAGRCVWLGEISQQ